MQYEAIIFDCDGTIANSMPAHYIAWVTTLERYGLEFSEDLFYETGGWSTLKVARHLLDLQGHDGDAAVIAEEKEDEFEKHLDVILPIEQTIEVVKVHFDKIPLAVATGGIPRVCHGILDNLGLRQYFQTIVTALDIEHPKPAPDTYLEAARRLGVNPAKCLAYEDTDPGIESARQAGMSTIDVRTYFKPERVTAG
ncbi:HAD-IA family hydrolase [Rubinisphaera sp.]|uniref:HAD family hydrolase n=1 Tax=Rubinisphaera sp. TaxID=2024857 RepID=UPI000C0F77F1|nr:HAD-IA family hydrolase [Rubinisphaera sp.]MBV10573.1 HAD family hydrolase [Rubinisphaera sp.]HCS51592.1 HAD family hydrolase [Planctomycetaceae bacterium]